MKILTLLFLAMNTTSTHSAVLGRYEISGRVVGFDETSYQIRSGATVYKVPKSAIPFRPKVDSEVTFAWARHHKPTISVIRPKSSRLPAASKPAGPVTNVGGIPHPQR